MGSYIADDSLILPNEQDVSGYASAVTNKAFMIGPEKEYGPSMGGAYGDSTRDALTKEGITFLVQNNSVVAYGVSGATGTGRNATAGDTDEYLLPSYSEHLMGNADIVATAVPMPRTTVHYHNDVTSQKAAISSPLIWLGNCCFYCRSKKVVSYFPKSFGYLEPLIPSQYASKSVE